MEKPACDVLGKRFDKIIESNVDSAWLAGKLLSAGIIGRNDVEKASSGRELETMRRRELVLTVMGNGAPDVFQTFVDILLSERHLMWLGKELKGMTSITK